MLIYVQEQLDVLENELDDLDPVKVHAGELFGEALLATCYSSSPNAANPPSTYANRRSETLSKLSKVDDPESNDRQADNVSKGSSESSSQEKIMSPRYKQNFSCDLKIFHLVFFCMFIRKITSGISHPK